MGLVSPADALVHYDQMGEVDVDAALQIEAETRHDVAAELALYADQCGEAGKALHLGATSSDIEDNAIMLQINAAIGVVFSRMISLFSILKRHMVAHCETVCMGYTHWQPAEPTTIGYRLSLYVQDLFEDLNALIDFRHNATGKGATGAVGTSASFVQLLGATDKESAVARAQRMSDELLQGLGLERPLVTGQTYPRKQDFQLINALAGIAATLHKMALDMRILQSAGFGEVKEGKRPHQVSSTAMPFKSNPITSEGICSLARLVAQMPRVAWDNAANSGLERTLDDKANRRVIIPEAFLAVDEMLRKATNLLWALDWDEGQINQNLARWGMYSATERVLMAAIKAGANREAVHDKIAQVATEAHEKGRPNHLYSLARDEYITQYLDPQEVCLCLLLDVNSHIGQAIERTQTMVYKTGQVMDHLTELVNMEEILNAVLRERTEKAHEGA
jgi:adenylosuccinate lyase